MPTPAPQVLPSYPQPSPPSPQGHLWEQSKGSLPNLLPTGSLVESTPSTPLISPTLPLSSPSRLPDYVHPHTCHLHLVTRPSASISRTSRPNTLMIFPWEPALCTDFPVSVFFQMFRQRKLGIVGGGAGWCTAKWWSACLACRRFWAQSPVPTF